MAQLLVVVADKVNKEDVYLDAKCYKRGHVVSVYEDSVDLPSYPGIAEKLGSFWTVVKVPGTAVDALSAYLVPELGDPKVNRMLQRRAFKFDLASGKTLITATEAQALKTVVSPLADPNVIA